MCLFCQRMPSLPKSSCSRCDEINRTQLSGLRLPIQINIDMRDWKNVRQWWCDVSQIISIYSTFSHNLAAASEKCLSTIRGLVCWRDALIVGPVFPGGVSGSVSVGVSADGLRLLSSTQRKFNHKLLSE